MTEPAANPQAGVTEEMKAAAREAWRRSWYGSPSADAALMAGLKAAFALSRPAADRGQIVECKPTVSVDSKTGTLYVNFCKGAPADNAIDIDGVIVRYKDGTPIGVTVLDARPVAEDLDRARGQIVEECARVALSHIKAGGQQDVRILCEAVATSIRALSPAPAQTEE